MSGSGLTKDFDAPRELAGRLRRAIAGPMWHGPAVDELVLRFTHESALQRPIANAHSAWELVLHMTAWARFGIARMSGDESFDVSPDDDFPPQPTGASATDWSAAVGELREAYAVLGDLVRSLPPNAMLQPVANRDYNVVTLLNGIVEHATYHGGQLALLARALER